jgi:hypothetical protein
MKHVECRWNNIYSSKPSTFIQHVGEEMGSPGIHCNCVVKDGPNKRCILPRPLTKPYIFPPRLVCGRQQPIPFDRDGLGKLLTMIQQFSAKLSWISEKWALDSTFKDPTPMSWIKWNGSYRAYHLGATTLVLSLGTPFGRMTNMDSL